MKHQQLILRINLGILCTMVFFLQAFPYADSSVSYVKSPASILYNTPAPTSTTNITICYNQLPYQWNGLTCLTGGTYSVTLTGSNGQDSLAVLNLTVLNVGSSITNAIVCDYDLPYQWNGNSYFASGTYSVTLTSASGCDSVPILSLTVNRRVTSLTNKTICVNQLPFSWNGNNYPSAGTYSVTLTSAAGCDSIASLNLQVKPLSSSVTSRTICNTQLPYFWNGFSYAAAGTYTVTLMGSNGCDSLATLNLVVAVAVSSSTVISICTNQLPFTWNSHVYTTAGIYSVLLNSSAGCDSLATLVLSVRPLATSTTFRTICTGQLPYTWNGNTYGAAGNYSVTLPGSGGCDSVAKLRLTVVPFLTGSTDRRICSNQLPYSWNGNSYPAAGTYSVTLVTVAGCDSIATLNLSVETPEVNTDNVVICQEQLPFNWHGQIFTTGGIYPIVPPLVLDPCHSIDTLNLVVQVIVPSTTNISVCSNQLPYAWNGSSLPGTGTYQAILTSSSGCDSIANLNLSVKPISTSTTNRSICDGQVPYLWNGILYTTTGSYTVRLNSANGCDSLATLNLLVNPELYSITDLSICNSELPFTWNGNSYATPGSYTVTLTGSGGCDSLATLNLSAHPYLTSSTNLSICTNQVPYTWNGNQYSTTGIYTVTLPSNSACDSLATLNLQVNPVLNSVSVVQVCHTALPFNWNGQQFTAAGIYHVSMLSSVGCDSVATLQLIVPPVDTSYTHVSICNNQMPYAWNGNSYPVAGNYPVTLTGSSGCDSVAILYLQVSDILTSTTNVTVCNAGLPFSWNGNAYSTPGTYAVTITTASGCDSVPILSLTIVPYYTSTTQLSICNSQLPYTWNGNSYATAGVYTVMLTGTAGCDSLATLDLSVGPVINSITQVSVCDNQLPYNWNGNSYSTTGSYAVTLTSSGGCDSIATLELLVNPVMTTDVNVNVCSNQLPYNWNGIDYSTGGTYAVTLQSTAGCDSIVSLHLSVLTLQSSNTSIQVCENLLPYAWNGLSLTTPGLYSVTLTGSNGCDSTANLSLHVNTVQQTTTVVNICASQLPYQWNGIDYTAAGLYQLTLTSSEGCDSLSSLQLNVQALLSGTDSVTLCESQLPYTWHGNSYALAGQYNILLTASNGCDSLAILQLTVNPVRNSLTELAICNNQLPFSWNGQTFVSAGTYAITLVSTAGCDSVATLHLVANSTVSSVTHVSICNSQLPYSWNGQSYAAAGTYTITLTSSSGCDSLTSLILSANDVVTSTTNVAICTSQLPFVWNANSYNLTGQYAITLVSQAGCDSIATLNLVVNSTVSSITQMSRCENQLPFVWNGQLLYTPGNYDANFTSSAGCDSIATLHFTVLPVTESLTIQAVCENQLPYQWNGNQYTAAGLYTFTLTGSQGCDSLAKLQLAVLPLSTSTSTVSICSNQFPFTWNGNTYTAAGTYSLHFTNSYGCDSTAVLIINEKPVSNSMTNLSICSNQLPYNWNGQTISTAGNYVSTLQNSAGCDSLATLQLMVSPVLRDTTWASTCNNQLPYLWNGQSYSASGLYSINLISSSGCDSIASLQLQVVPVTYSTTLAHTCNNQLPYTWNGQDYISSGNYTITLTGAAGCDSIATLQLQVDPVLTSLTQAMVCSAQLPYLWNGQSYNQPGSYSVTLAASTGCDSIASLQLTINITPAAPLVNSPVEYCQYETSVALSATAQTPGNQLNWYAVAQGGSATLTAPVPSTLAPGTFIFYVSEKSTFCEGPRAAITVTVNPKPALGPDKDLRICFGESANLLNLYHVTGLNGLWTISGIPVPRPDSVSIAGYYQLVVQTLAGCADTATVNLNIQPPVHANAGNDAFAEYNIPYALQGSGGGSYEWSPAGSLNHPFIANPLATLTHDETFVLTVKDEIGCKDMDTVIIKVLNGPTFYVPTAFTPNGDGLNDIFRPTSIGIASLEYFRVFNRYGELVYETHDIGKGWDGNYKGLKQPLGNYVWSIRGTDRTGKLKFMKGNVVLIR
ncbi:MAG TPA: gliding motility-associated C-terminal domain-containing protein [Ferruginibacter sp.]|nr:gliding motility-associated C-terminal domain-containing protein [Ferruginibacter sp.]